MPTNLNIDFVPFLTLNLDMLFLMIDNLVEFLVSDFLISTKSHDQ